MTPSSLPVFLVHSPTHARMSEDLEAVLTARLRAQIEYYFSYQNLCQDHFLQSFLTSTAHLGAVPMEIIANFPKVRKLYGSSMGIYGMLPPADHRLIARALDGSQVVSVSPDGRWLIPLEMPDFHSLSQRSITGTATSHSNMGGTELLPEPSSPCSQNTSVSSIGVPTYPFPAYSKQRCTVIVRDLHPDCTVEEIMEVFATEKGSPKSARIDVGNTWYITFSTEAKAFAAVTASWGKNMHGSPIRARVKSETPAQKEPPIPPPRQPVSATARAYAPYPYLIPQSPAVYSFVSHPCQSGSLPYIPMKAQTTAPMEMVDFVPHSSASGQHMQQHIAYGLRHWEVTEIPPVMQVAVPPDRVVSDYSTERKRDTHKKRYNKKRANSKEWCNGDDQQNTTNKVAGIDNNSSASTPTKKPPRRRHHRRSPRGNMATIDKEPHAEEDFPLIAIGKQSLNDENFPSLGAGDDNVDKAQNSSKLFGYARALLNSSGEWDGDATLQLSDLVRNSSISAKSSE